MEPSTLNALVAGAIGLVSGAIGSLIAPWISWGIEKKRKKLDRKADLIKSWREVLQNEEFSRTLLLNHPTYGSLRELLNEGIREQIERPSNHFIIDKNSPTANPDKKILLREIARIEKLWGLL